MTIVFFVALYLGASKYLDELAIKYDLAALRREWAAVSGRERSYREKSRVAEQTGRSAEADYFAEQAEHFARVRQRAESHIKESEK
jgi:hypothetical protein